MTRLTLHYKLMNSLSITAAAVFAFCEVRRWTRNRMTGFVGMQLDPFKIIWQQRLFVFQFPAY